MLVLFAGLAPLAVRLGAVGAVVGSLSVYEPADSNSSVNSLAHPDDQIGVLTVGLQFFAGGVQIGDHGRP